VPEILLAAIGRLPPGRLDELAVFLSVRTGCPCRVSGEVIEPDASHDSRRDQYDCRRLFPALEALASASGRIVLGVADVDLYSAIFTFVFGESKLGGTAGMVSLYRLRPALYGLPDDPELERTRAQREALHEVGHLLGLVHCRSADCVMRFSGSVEEVDLKRGVFCDVCRAEIPALGGAEAPPSAPAAPASAPSARATAPPTRSAGSAHPRSGRWLRPE